MLVVCEFLVVVFIGWFVGDMFVRGLVRLT